MMPKLPIAVCLFTSTKGHFGYSTYEDTLNHLNKQIPLSYFSALYSHIKISPGSEEIAERMADNLKKRGFHVETTVGEWSRGMSHQNAYLEDMRKASQSQFIQSQPYMLLLEDDSPFLCHEESLTACLQEMVRLLHDCSDVVSTRFIRKIDFDGGVPIIYQDKNYFWSPNFDFQPAILRSRDYLLANKVIEDNWNKLSQTQCELAMRLALDTLTREKEYKHMVWLPSYGETIHIGTQNYPEIVKNLKL